MKCVTFNTNSIRARLPIVQAWLDRERPDVLLLQETKVQDKDFPAGPFEDMGYHAVFKGQKSYNGVAIISEGPPRDIRTGLYGEGDEEARFISAVIRGIPMINVYVPQGSAPGTDKFHFKLRWLKDLLSHIREAYDTGKPLLLGGDFNVALEPIDVYDPEGLKGEVGFHPDEQAVMREFLDWGFVDIFRRHHQEGGHYTFWDYRIPNALKRKMGWRIDHIWTTPPLAERSQGAYIDREARMLKKPSDHTFLVVEFEV
jgi:exodeoxyribonuclease-3